MIDTIWTRPQIDSSYCIWKYELQTFESSTTCAMSTHFQVSWNKNNIFKVVRLWELGGLRRANCSVIFKVILKVAKLQRLSWFLKLNVKYTVVSAHYENKIKYSFSTTYKILLENCPSSYDPCNMQQSVEQTQRSDLK